MRYLYWFLFCLLLSAGTVAGQAVRWERTLGSIGRTGGWGICPAPDGGVVTIGFRNAARSASLADSSKGNADACVVKYSPTGQVQWNRALGGTLNDYGWRVRPTPDGGYLLSIESASGQSFDHSQPSKGLFDYWVVKLDGQGNKQWDRSFGTDSLDYIADAWPTADGGYQLIGSSYAVAAQGDKSEPGRGFSDYWTIKLDAQGNKLWDRTYGGPGYEELMEGQPTPDGGSLLMGTTTSPAGGDLTQAGPGAAGDADYWVVKLDAQGNKLWDRRYGGLGDENGQACILTPDGGYLVGGASVSGQGGDKSQPSRGDSDYWVLKLDGQGLKQWDATLGSAGYEFLNQGLVALAGGGYVVVGQSSGGVSGDHSQPTRGGTDCWAVGLSTTGQVLWNAVYGGGDEDNIKAACPTADGGFSFTSASFSAISGDRTSPQLGSEDQWTVKATATGTKQWDRAYGGNVDDLQQALVQAPDGTLWLAGQTAGGEGLDNAETGGYYGIQHGWLLQRDSLGDALQTASVASTRHYVVNSLDFAAGSALLTAGTTKIGDVTVYEAANLPDANYYLQRVGGAYIELGGPGDDYLSEARVTPDQGAILGGTSRSGMGRQKTAPSRGGADFWLVKLSRTFTQTWDHAYGGTGLDSLVSVRRTADGGYLLAGSTTSPVSGDLTEPSRGGADYWLVKVNSQGVLQWQHRYGGPANDWLAAARPTPDGGYVLLGTTSSGVGSELTEAPLGRRDLWVVKVSSTGAVQWQHRYGGSGNDYAATLENDPDGGFILGANTTSPAGGQVSLPSRGGTDYWLLRLSAQGTVLWDQRLGGSGEDLLTCLATTKGYGYAVGGSSNSPASSGEHQQANKDGYDYWTLLLGARRVPAPIITAFTPALGLPGTQVVLTGSNFTGTSSVQVNGLAAPGFVVSNAGTTLTMTLPLGATTGLLTVTANGTGTSATAFVVPTDLIISSPVNVQGTYQDVTVTGPVTGGAGVGTLTGSLTVLGRLLVQDGGTLLTNCQPLIGSGSFELAAGGTLGICDAAGLSTSPNTGAVQVTGPRSFATDAVYLYNGTVAQVTGTALPATVRELGLSNGAGLTLSQAISLTQRVNLLAGDLALASQPLTLLSTAGGTALLNNAGGRVLGATGTMQRFIATNAGGSGYRHYSSPVADDYVSTLATAGYVPDFSQAAAYNTSATPGSVSPFPTVFTYNQNRIATSLSNYSPFDKGWQASSGTDPLLPGTGVTVQAPGAALIDFTGTFTTGPLAQGTLSRTGANDGWHLLGNPYPSPLDWSTMTLGAGPGANLQHVDGALYIFQSSGPYAGAYRTYLAAAPGQSSPLVPAGQGFFVRTTTPGIPGTVRFTEANRVRTFGLQPAFGRTAADPRPLLTLSLQGNAIGDEMSVYFDAAATIGLDAAYDATKLLNPSGLNLAAWAGPTMLALDGLPAQALVGSSPVVVPLRVGVPLAGPYTLRVAELLNFDSNRVYLHDALAGTELLLVANQVVSLNLLASPSASLRFSLVIRPAGVLATTSTAPSLQASVYPNPAHGAFTLRLPPIARVTQVKATLVNALSQVVLTRSIVLATSGATTEISTQGLAAGTYALRLLADTEIITLRVVVE